MLIWQPMATGGQKTVTLTSGTQTISTSSKGPNNIARGFDLGSGGGYYSSVAAFGSVSDDDFGGRTLVAFTWSSVIELLIISFDTNVWADNDRSWYSVTVDGNTYLRSDRDFYNNTHLSNSNWIFSGVSTAPFASSYVGDLTFTWR